MNNVTITGTLADEPWLERSDADVTSTMRVSIVDRRGRVDETITVEVVAHGSRAETVGRHLHKGRLVAVTGRLIEVSGANQHRRWSRLQILAASIDFLDAPTARPESAHGAARVGGTTP
jgi:single-stranded DNA-binding protein